MHVWTTNCVLMSKILYQKICAYLRLFLTYFPWRSGLPTRSHYFLLQSEWQINVNAFHKFCRRYVLFTVTIVCARMLDTAASAYINYFLDIRAVLSDKSLINAKLKLLINKKIIKDSLDKIEIDSTIYCPTKVIDVHSLWHA